jgi:tetratricopeptide (TPR) repeat protein
MRRHGLCLALTLLALAAGVEAQVPPAPAPVPAPAPRGIGPFSLETARGPLTVRLLRRDRDLIWIVQQLTSGQTVDTALPAREITRFILPRPRLFQALDVATKEQARALRPQLEGYIRQLTPYRDLPGLNVDEAQLLLGRLLEQEEDWKGAAAVYADIIAQPYKPAESARAGLRRGLCLARLDQAEEAAPLLATDGLGDEDDLELVSDVYFARGAVFQKLGRHEEALLSLLHLVVFLPYVRDNEPRALAEALPSYAALNDWDAAYKTVQQLRASYAESPAAKQADLFAETYPEQMKKEADFRGVTEEEAAPEEGEIHEETE